MSFTSNETMQHCAKLIGEVGINEAERMVEAIPSLIENMHRAQSPAYDKARDAWFVDCTVNDDWSTDPYGPNWDDYKDGSKDKDFFL